MTTRPETATFAVFGDLVRECLSEGMTPGQVREAVEEVLQLGATLNESQMRRLGAMFLPEAEWTLTRRGSITAALEGCRFDILPSSKLVQYDVDPDGRAQKAGVRVLTNQHTADRARRYLPYADLNSAPKSNRRRDEPATNLRILGLRLDHKTGKIVRTAEEGRILLMDQQGRWDRWTMPEEDPSDDDDYGEGRDD